MQPPVPGHPRMATHLEPKDSANPWANVVTLLRRFIVLIALMFWQGGFTFYAAVVVPVGQSVLQSHLEQGFITRQVTTYLNLAGIAALFCFAWDAIASRDPIAIRRRARWAACLAMAVALVLLLWFHGSLDRLLDPESRSLVDAKEFRPLHRWYLWISTLQWGCAVIYCLLTLAAWKAEDSAMAFGEAAKRVE
jgi:hypothetical protein